MYHQVNNLLRCIVPSIFVVLLSGPAWAADGNILINQSKAINGNVTPGDAAGFPVTISRSGSYRLSGNLTVPNANTTAISITADNVTLDLNGFGIYNTGAFADGTGKGVDASGKLNTTVINGTVRSMGDTGISLGPLARVERVQALLNFEYGIEVGSNSTVSGNIVNGNSVFGIYVSSNSSLVTGNTVTSNGNAGIRAVASNTITGNTANNNGGNGIDTDRSTISGNTTIGNGSAGILIGCPGVVTGNTSTANTSANIFTFGAGCVLQNNTP